MVNLANAKQFPKVVVIIYIPSAGWKSSCHDTFSFTLGVVSLSHTGLSVAFAAIVLLMFISLMIDKRVLFTYSLAVWISSSVKCLLKSFAHFIIGLSFILTDL